MCYLKESRRKRYLYLQRRLFKTQQAAKESAFQYPVHNAAFDWVNLLVRLSQCCPYWPATVLHCQINRLGILANGPFHLELISTDKIALQENMFACIVVCLPNVYPLGRFSHMAIYICTFLLQLRQEAAGQVCLNLFLKWNAHFRKEMTLGIHISNFELCVCLLLPMRS